MLVYVLLGLSIDVGGGGLNVRPATRSALLPYS